MRQFDQLLGPKDNLYSKAILFFWGGNGDNVARIVAFPKRRIAVFLRPVIQHADDPDGQGQEDRGLLT
jgi:hypothetical protein